MGGAIRTAGKHLGHFHTGECNRRVPGKGRMPWHEIGTALKDIAYQGAVVMEPFVKTGGRWARTSRYGVRSTAVRTLREMDRDAMESVRFLRYVFD